MTNRFNMKIQKKGVVTNTLSQLFFLPIKDTLHTVSASDQLPEQSQDRNPL